MSDYVKIKLDEIAQLQARLDEIRLHYGEMRDTILTPEVRVELENIRGEEELAVAEVQATIDTLTKEVNDEVLALGSSVKGEHLHAIFTKGRITWDSKGLDGYLVAHPEVGVFRKEGLPYVQIRGLK